MYFIATIIPAIKQDPNYNYSQMI